MDVETDVLLNQCSQVGDVQHKQGRPAPSIGRTADDSEPGSERIAFRPDIYDRNQSNTGSVIPISLDPNISKTAGDAI